MSKIVIFGAGKIADVSSIQINNEEEMNCIDTETNSDSFYEDPEGLKKRNSLQNSKTNWPR